MLYFHGAAEGRRWIWSGRPGTQGLRWTLPMALRRRTRPADIPSGTEAWWGRTHPGSGGDTGKEKGLNCIMGHMSGKDSWDYPEAMLKRTAVLRLDVEQMSGKEQV